MQFEPALEIVGRLKRRFGEPLTVTDLCRETPLSYQPVYEYVRRLSDAGALAVRKQGARLLCEPAATPAGSLWLAQWSVRELAGEEATWLGELAAATEGRMRDRSLPPTAIVALDPGSEQGAELRSTAALPEGLASRAAGRTLSAAQFAEWLRGREGRWEVARRVIPLAGHQALWALALAAREATRGPAPPAPTGRRRSIFGD